MAAARSRAKLLVWGYQSGRRCSPRSSLPRDADGDADGDVDADGDAKDDGGVHAEPDVGVDDDVTDDADPPFDADDLTSDADLDGMRIPRGTAPFD